ncbi:hypothetical protein [Xenorhabdus littoralis]|uniref:hypothetical protein n=1 Tax=Xenorhabdus littoralis TaxID=2582835 RepID=UPI0029E7DCF8|nr:hypothetical protein [Xenorhabdus sp. Reich]
MKVKIEMTRYEIEKYIQPIKNTSDEMIACWVTDGMVTILEEAKFPESEIEIFIIN